MSSFGRRMTLLYALLALVMLVAIEAAIAGIALAVVDRNLTQSVQAVGNRVPLTVAAVRGTRTLADAAFAIIARLRTPDVDVTIVDSTAHAGYRDQPPPFTDAGPGSGPNGPGEAGGPGADGPGPGGPGPGGPELSGSGFAGPGPGNPGPRPPPVARSRTSASGQPNAFLWALFSVTPLRVATNGGAVLLAPTGTRLASIASVFGIALLLGLAFAVVAATLIGRYVSQQALRPLERVVAELYRFGSGDFSLREIDPAIANEFVDLARAYNAAGAQVQRAFDERAKAERDMRQFVADAAHELRTPLTIVTGYVDVLRQGIEPSDAERIFETIRVESRRMRELIAKLIVLARLDAPQRRPFEIVDLSRLVEGALDAMTVVLAGNAVRLDVRTGIEVMGDPDELRDALHNLVTNAAKYAPGSTVSVSLNATEAEAVLVVADDGPGMNELERENAFSRFYRGDNRGEIEGSGLGLPIVRGVAERAGGSVTLESSPAAGARFTITLPRFRRVPSLAQPGDARSLRRF